MFLYVLCKFYNFEEVDSAKLIPFVRQIGHKISGSLEDKSMQRQIQKYLFQIVGGGGGKMGSSGKEGEGESICAPTDVLFNVCLIK